MSILHRVFPLASTSLVACTAQAVPGPGGPRLPSVDIAVPVHGVPDRGDDPAVVLVESGAALPCAGVLLAADVVLTAGHCAAAPGSGSSFQCASVQSSSGTLFPMPLPPSSLRVLVGGDAISAVERARARAILTPSPGQDGCLADIALLLLDQSIDDIAPVLVHPTAAAQGDHLRTVGFEPAGAGGVVTRFLKDHVPVAATSPIALDVYEDGCAAGCGGPALDESTGEVVGVASRWVPADGALAPFDEYVPTDAFLGLVGEALARSTAAATSASGVSLQKADKAPADMGAACAAGVDCAAGACVTDGAQRYCTRQCSADDACPTHFRCEDTSEGSTVCIEG
jgi:hypothetical protein